MDQVLELHRDAQALAILRRFWPWRRARRAPCWSIAGSWNVLPDDLVQRLITLPEQAMDALALASDCAKPSMASSSCG